MRVSRSSTNASKARNSSDSSNNRNQLGRHCRWGKREAWHEMLRVRKDAEIGRETQILLLIEKKATIAISEDWL